MKNSTGYNQQFKSSGVVKIVVVRIQIFDKILEFSVYKESSPCLTYTCHLIIINIYKELKDTKASFSLSPFNRLACAIYIDFIVQQI